MRFRSLALVLGCLAIVTNAQAGSTWLGPSIAFPVPGADVGSGQLGVDAGLMLQQMANSHVGIGLDVVYHYWPASSEYMAAYDHYLRGWFQTFDSSTWSFSAIQVTGHVKFVGPAVGGGAPWVRVGAGIYRVNRNLADPNWEGSPVVVLRGGPERIVVLPGGYCSVGVDFRTSSRVVLGVNATYQVLEQENAPSVWGGKITIPSFSAFTIGTHILFGK